VNIFPRFERPRGAAPTALPAETLQGSISDDDRTIKIARCVIDDELRMSVRQSRAIAGAVALFAFAAVLLEVALVRMYTALLGQHFGVAWAIVLPFGVGLGALITVFTGSAGRASFRAAAAAHLTAFAAPCAAISVIFGVRAKGVDNFDAAALQQLALFFGTSLLPFVFVGSVFSRILGSSQKHAAGLLRTALAAAACAIVASAFVMRFGPARVGLGVAVAMSLAAVLFARASRFDTEGQGASTSLVATFVLGMSVVLAGEIGAPYLKLASLRWMGLEKADTQMWTARGFYTVDKPQANAAMLRVDGTFGRSIPDGKQIPPLAADEMAYLLQKGEDPVLIVGAGGGRELRAALRQGHHDVYGIEEDITIGRTIMRGSSYAFTEELYDKPEVHVTVEGAKNYVRRNPGAFQRIVVGYYDTLAPAPSGSLAASANPTLTTEFVQDLLGALRPDGTLTLMRPDPELDRMIVLAAHALRAKGSRTPGMHMFGCSRDKLSIIVVKRSPLQSDDVSTLRTHCRRHKFVEILSPDAVKDEARKALMAGLNPSIMPSGQPSDLRPPTEDRPFWFHTVAPERLVSTLRDIRGLVERQRVLLVLGAGIALSAALGFLALLVSFAPPGRFWGYQRRFPVTRISFTLASIVAAIVLIGNALMARAESVVGRPDVVALFFPLVFLLTISIGAGFGRGFDDDDARAGLQRWLLATTFVLAPLLMGLDGILSLVVDLTLPLRIAVPAVILSIVGTGLGLGLGLGVRIAASWGVRTCASALAYAGIGASGAMLLGIFVSMSWGYSATLLVGSAAMILAILFAASARIDAPYVPVDFQALSSDDTASDDEPISFDDRSSTSTTVSL
jgi:hypothetical protein